ncbi:MAG: hypothetical protein U9O06_14330 [Euryarchaeota archaeon]|nr:hypothetical protein [Euryarchaeota archaeon]
MNEPDSTEDEPTLHRSGSAGTGRSRWFENPDTRLLLVGTLAVGVAIGALLVGGLPTSEESPPDPEIESVEILDAGCHNEVRSWAMSSSDGVWVSTINNTAKQTAVSAQIRRTSPPDATVATYRLSLETHNTTVESDECPGRIVYRVEYDAPYPDAADAMRTERYVDGEFHACGSSTSGPEPGCAALYEDRPTQYSNGTVTYESA